MEIIYIILAVGIFFTQIFVNGSGLLWAIMVAAIWPVVLPFWVIYEIFRPKEQVRFAFIRASRHLFEPHTKVFGFVVGGHYLGPVQVQFLWVALQAISMVLLVQYNQIMLYSIMLYGQFVANMVSIRGEVKLVNQEGMN